MIDLRKKNGPKPCGNSPQGFLFARKRGEDVPRSPKKPCAYPGCPRLTNRRFCPEHEKLDRDQYNRYERSPDVNKKYGRAWNGTYVVGGSLSNQYAYDIRIAVSDYFETVYAYADLATADTIFSIRNNGLGLAIGKICEQNKFEIGWQSEFHEDVAFDGDVSFSSLAWLRDAIFPVGSIRMTTSTTGATTFLGGTWVLWGAGKVPVGVDSSDSDFSTVEKTGGAKTVTLAAANMPSHNHALSSGTVTVTAVDGHTHQAASGTYKVGSGSGSSYKYFTNGGSTGPATTGSGGGHTHTATLSGNTGSKGSGTAHNNVQPYITCYFYKRTA